MRADLIAAMKARDLLTVAALRTAIAAIDNAEAVDGPDPSATATSSEHVAGARAGTGSAEAARRALSTIEVEDLLRTEIDARRSEADRYEYLGEVDAAVNLRTEAEVLVAYLQSDQ